MAKGIFYDGFFLVTKKSLDTSASIYVMGFRCFSYAIEQRDGASVPLNDRRNFVSSLGQIRMLRTLI